MIHGEVERDPRGFDVARFGNWTSPGYTVPKVIENYQMRFSVAIRTKNAPQPAPSAPRRCMKCSTR
jgi:dimethylglycine dehydrogenase